MSMRDRRAPLPLIAGLTLASPSLLDAIAHRLMLCLPDTWAPATMVGVSVGLLAFVALTAWRTDLRCLLVIGVRSIVKEIEETDA
jgi:hypothetical protein